MKKLVIALFLIGNLISKASAQYLVEAIGLEAFDRTVIVDHAFLEYIWIMDELALENNLEIKVQGRGFREAGAPVQNAVVPPSETSNHLIGHAVDINIAYNRVLYNSARLGNYASLPQAIKNFIAGCERNGLRWGGRFSDPDPVHFDDNLYLRDKRTYDRLYREFQQ
jgi:hypothetical protein